VRKSQLRGGDLKCFYEFPVGLRIYAGGGGLFDLDPLGQRRFIKRREVLHQFFGAVCPWTIASVVLVFGEEP
jgi:hypothetical protein